MKKFKNNTEALDTWVGQGIEAGAYYELQPQELHLWQNDSKVLADIASGDGIINDGSSDILDVAAAINFLKDVDDAQKDSDGALLSRLKITSTGWHIQLHSVEFELGKLDSVYSKKADNSNYGFAILKFYELINDVETQITGENLNQEYLDLHCIRTVMEWEPNHDIEILGGTLKQLATATEDVRLWVVGVPDVPLAYGGSKPFCVNMNLRFLDGSGFHVDGKAAKYLTYNSQNHTSKIQMIFRHPVGYKQKLMMIFEFFKA